MTRAEAATRLSMIFANCDTEMCKGAYVCKYCDEAINMAIKALGQDPCDDCIWFRQGVQRTRMESDGE